MFLLYWNTPSDPRSSNVRHVLEWETHQKVDSSVTILSIATKSTCLKSILNINLLTQFSYMQHGCSLTLSVHVYIGWYWASQQYEIGDTAILVCFLCSSGCHQEHLFWLVFDMMFLWQNFDLPIFVREKEAKHFRSHYITQISCQGQDSWNHK